MSQLSDDEKLSIIREFILDSPPGEINDVFNDAHLLASARVDVRALLDNDSLLQAGVADTFAEYNTEHLLSVALPGSSHQVNFILVVLLSKYGQLEDGRFIDPRSSQSFAFDHIRQVVSDVQPYEADAESEAFRWRSLWTARIGSTELSGVVKVNIHYYEDGNVQLNTNKSFATKLSAAPSDPKAFATAVLKEIMKIEGDYQIGLNENYGLLAKTAFKSLRRGLPIKGTKMEWHALSNYKIGNELAKK
ncbi:hypothetical protein HDU67_010356 [Dinochytrium kinnereticum]|nr:hypothetical protein HDU67_010356 [Dinochytrium kinnereticum]